MTSFSFIHDRGVVPLEVYDRDLMLVERTLSSQSIELESGSYYVVGHLPDGGSLRATVEVSDTAFETAEKVQLTPESQSGPGAAPNWPGRVRRLMFALRLRTPPMLVGYKQTREHDWARVAEWAIESLPRDLDVSDFAHDALVLEQPGAPSTCVRLPGGRTEYFRFVLRPREAGRVILDVRLADSAADGLLSYLDEGLVAGAAQLASSLAHHTVEQLLYGEHGDPVAAAAVAYALLRVDDLERLHDWTRNLSEFEWLPDGLVVHAEHAARAGDHKSALENLRQLPQRGLPAFSMGLGYAVDRLRTYARLMPDDEDLRERLADLTRYAVATDFSARITTFAGDRPDAPTPPGPRSATGRRARARAEQTLTT